MGNSALQCVSDQWRAARLVYPDGHVESLPAKSCTVAELLQKLPRHGARAGVTSLSCSRDHYFFVCNGSPLILKNRMPPDAKFDPDQTYFLCVIPAGGRAAPHDPSGPRPSTASDSASRKRIQSSQQEEDSSTAATHVAAIRFKSSRVAGRANATPGRRVPSVVRAGIDVAADGRESRRSSRSLSSCSPASSRRVFDSAQASTMSWVSASKAHHPAGLVEELHKINNITVDQKQRQKLTSTKLLFFRRFLAVVVRRHPGAAASNLSSKAAAGGSIKLLQSSNRRHMRSSGVDAADENVVALEYKTSSVQTISRRDPAAAGMIKSCISISAISSSNVQRLDQSYATSVGRRGSHGYRPTSTSRLRGSRSRAGGSSSAWKPMLQSISEVTVAVEFDRQAATTWACSNSSDRRRRDAAAAVYHHIKRVKSSTTDVDQADNILCYSSNHIKSSLHSWLTSLALALSLCVYLVSCRSQLVLSCSSWAWTSSLAPVELPKFWLRH